MTLNPQQIKHLKSLAHALNPIVRIGQNGVTPPVLRELDIALEHHELVKVKLAGSDRDARAKMMTELIEKSGASSIQQIGGVIVLFRRNSKKPVISF
ncbi:MAG: ribosome assembly RNA-binding protein YhbY [Granulosicoccus sp.]|nr:ribosome assembly RNA-binding protein YhbY [Granulosicoccus sp.]